MIKKITKILVANRGEIAIRVMKTAQKMGIKTVAVYSTIDRNAPHVKFADEAVWIGESPSNQSYLLGNKIIEVAKSLGADAIHPGYGFLSENAAFAEEAEKNNIIFIGPKSKAIHIMGSKLAAKEAVNASNLPEAIKQLSWVQQNTTDASVKAIAQIRLARVQRETGDYVAALATLNQTVPASFAAQQVELKGDVLQASGDLPAAKAAYQQALAQAGQNTQLLQIKLDELAHIAVAN